MKQFIAASVIAGALATPALALDQQNVVALVEMPVAVARVAEVPTVEEVLLNELLDVLFEAELPPTEFIDIVRYTPMLLVEERDPELDLIELIRLRQSEGLAGVALATALRQDLRTWGIPIEPQVQLVELPRVTSREFFPAVVVDRIGSDRLDLDSSHPHGGPPGQIKKDLGLQTGAEVVHGERPGRRDDDRNVPRAVVDRDRDDDRPGVARNQNDRRNEPRTRPQERGNRNDVNRGNSNNPNRGNDRNMSRGNSGNKDKGKPGNNGKGKGGSR